MRIIENGLAESQRHTAACERLHKKQDSKCVATCVKRRSSGWSRYWAQLRKKQPRVKSPGVGVGWGIRKAGAPREVQKKVLFKVSLKPRWIHLQRGEVSACDKPPVSVFVCVGGDRFCSELRGAWLKLAVAKKNWLDYVKGSEGINHVQAPVTRAGSLELSSNSHLLFSECQLVSFSAENYMIALRLCYEATNRC